MLRSLFYTTALLAVTKAVVVPIPDNGFISLTTVPDSKAFRVSVSFSHKSAEEDMPPLDTPMLDKISEDKGTVSSDADGWVQVSSSFGSVAVNEKTGAFRLSGPNNTVIDTDQSAFELSAQMTGLVKEVSSNSTCQSPSRGFDVTGGSRTSSCPDGLANTTEASCCNACDKDSECKGWIFATDDGNQGKNCWLMATIDGTQGNANRILGGNFPRPVSPSIVQVTLQSSSHNGDDIKYFGSGGGGDASKTLTVTKANPIVENKFFQVPYYFSTAGYSVLTVSGLADLPSALGTYGASWTSDGGDVTWTISTFKGRKQADFYFMPVQDQDETNYYTAMSEMTTRYFRLIGMPRKPPLYAFGFAACRWGWQNRTDIHDMLNKFRSGNFPIDSWISDFEWYTKQPDYNLPSQGSPDFTDFWFNNVTFPAPSEQLFYYHDKLNMRFGGIRKPRLGNSDSLVMARAKNWTIGQGTGGAAGGTRNLNYTLQDVQTWYSEQLPPLLNVGVDFWWNDEGESTYHNFHWWNVAEVASLDNSPGQKRFWSINRAFTPGMSRLGGIVTWTGDVPPSWDALQNTPGTVLNWALAGSPYVTCDTGGFSGPTNALLLSRWYQTAVFMPVMRVHSTINTVAHFPFLWGEEAADSMRKSLELRYRLIPYTYSLAQDLYEEGTLMTRPLIMDFASDDDFVLKNGADITQEWMFGPSILVAPVMYEDNHTDVVLPTIQSGYWYEFNSTVTHDAVTPGTTVSLFGVPLNQIPIYVKPGSIIPIAGLVQYTDALPESGPLQVHIYSGDDNSFTLTEDDGATNAYINSDNSVRQTNFVWNEKTKTLSWTTTGSAKATYKDLEVWYWSKNEENAIVLGVTSLEGTSGSCNVDTKVCH